MAIYMQYGKIKGPVTTDGCHRQLGHAHHTRRSWIGPAFPGARIPGQ